MAVLEDLAKETAKYAFPRRFEARNLEEFLMSGLLLWVCIQFSIFFFFKKTCLNYCCFTVPDLETVKFRVLKRTEQYEIREMEVYNSTPFDL